MTGTFRAIRASKGEKAPQVEFANLTEADLMEGDVTVAVDYSTVNYKDGLALTGAAPIIAQAAVPVVTGDTPDTLSARVLEAEHQLYPQALAMVASGAVRMGADGQTVFKD